MSKELYVIKHPDGYYKFGVSSSPRERVKQVQSTCPKQLVLMARVSAHLHPSGLGTGGAGKLENQIHRALSDDHVRGEWFAISENIVGAVLKGETEAVDEELIRQVRWVRWEPDATAPNVVSAE